jgi:hypothetical protein
MTFRSYSVYRRWHLFVQPWVSDEKEGGNYDCSKPPTGMICRSISILRHVLALVAIWGAVAVNATPLIAGKVDAAPALTRSDVESWADGFVPVSLNAHDIAGAVVVVVQGDKILFSKGYGYSSVRNRQDAFSSGLDLQTVYLDCVDAAG